MKYILAIAVALVMSNISVAATLFRWVDKDGKVHYGDSPASDAVKTERRKISSSGSDDEEDLPYSVQKARQDFPVTLYTSKSCGDLCNQAAALLAKRGIPYTEKAISYNNEAEEARKQDGVTGFPAIKIGRSVLNGYSEQQWNSELDLAGYPKTRPVGIRLKKNKPQGSETGADAEGQSGEGQQQETPADNTQ